MFFVIINYDIFKNKIKISKNIGFLFYEILNRLNYEDENENYGDKYQMDICCSKHNWPLPRPRHPFRPLLLNQLRNNHPELWEECL